MARKKSKSRKRVLAGKKAARTRKRNALKHSRAPKRTKHRRKAKRSRKHTYRGIIGGTYSYGAFGRSRHKAKRRGKRGGQLLGYGKCHRCPRIIFGGAKGMATHQRRHHRGKK